MAGDTEIRRAPIILIKNDEPNFALALRISLEDKSCQVITISHRRETEETISIEEPDALVSIGRKI